MAVVLTQEVCGLNVGDTYTEGVEGPRESWLLASGYAKREGYTGPGVANTGPADVPLAENAEFDTEQGAQIASGSALPEGATNDDITLVDTPEPTVSWGSR